MSPNMISVPGEQTLPANVQLGGATGKKVAINEAARDDDPVLDLT